MIGITQEATDDDSFNQTEDSLPIEPSVVVIERSPTPPVEKEKEIPVKEEKGEEERQEEEGEEEEGEEEESILSPSRKADATGDSGTGTGGTSIPSTPDSVFLERTIDRSDIESTSG